MSFETIITYFIVAVAFVVAFIILRWLQSPKSGTRRLAITVWASFGPYETAEDAEDGLRRACRAVFGCEQIANHEEWINGHVKNFYDWQAEGRFPIWQKIMRTGLLLTGYGRAFDAACKEVKAEAVTKGIEAMERLNKDFLEQTGHRLEAVKQLDGTVQFLYKQVWSDEEIQRREKETGEAVLNSIGRKLLQDQSKEAKELLSFLGAVYKANMKKDLKAAKDVGVIWFACMELIDKDADSEVSQTFKALNNAWNSSMSDTNNDSVVHPKLQNQNNEISWSDNPGCFERHLQRKYRNPLFPPVKQNVTQRDVDIARHRDEKDAVELQEELEKLLLTVKDLPDQVDFKQTSNIREKIDTLLHKAAEVGGGTGDSVEITLHKLRKVLVDTQKIALADNDKALDALNKAEQYHQSGAVLFNNTFVAQMQRKDTPIVREDIIPSLLSQSPDTIRTVMKIIDDDVRGNVFRQGCIPFLREAKTRGISIPQLDEKLKAMGLD